MCLPRIWAIDCCLLHIDERVTPNSLTLGIARIYSSSTGFIRYVLLWVHPRDMI